MLLDLPDALRITRRRLRKSQTDVARDLGLERNTISYFENMRRGAHPATKRLIRMWILRNGTTESVE